MATASGASRATGTDTASTWAEVRAAHPKGKPLSRHCPFWPDAAKRDSLWSAATSPARGAVAALDRGPRACRCGMQVSRKTLPQAKLARDRRPSRLAGKSGEGALRACRRTPQASLCPRPRASPACSHCPRFPPACPKLHHATKTRSPWSAALRPAGPPRRFRSRLEAGNSITQRRRPCPLETGDGDAPDGIAPSRSAG